MIPCKYCQALAHIVEEHYRKYVYCVTCQQTYLLKIQHIDKPIDCVQNSQKPFQLTLGLRAPKENFSEIIMG